MAYTYTRTGWYARFDGKKTNGIVQRAIEAWSPAGVALIVNAKTGALTPAHDEVGFLELAPCKKLITMVPAEPGWVVRVDDEGERLTVPVVAWAFDDDGEGLPLCGGTDGLYVDDLGKGATLRRADDQGQDETAAPSPAE